MPKYVYRYKVCLVVHFNIFNGYHVGLVVRIRDLPKKFQPVRRESCISHITRSFGQCCDNKE